MTPKKAEETEEEKRRRDQHEHELLYGDLGTSQLFTEPPKVRKRSLNNRNSPDRQVRQTKNIIDFKTSCS